MQRPRTPRASSLYADLKRHIQSSFPEPGKTAQPNTWTRLLEAIPIMLPASLAAFGTVAMSLLLVERFQNIYIWPLGLFAAASASWLVYLQGDTARPGSLRERQLVGVLALVFVVAWTGVNMRHTSENIFVNRDPAIYTLAGLRLATHDNLRIEAPEYLRRLPGVTPRSAGFSTTPDNEAQLYVQGLHLLPALLGASGRVTSEAALLRLNPLLGGVALLSIYGFACLLVRPRWALLAIGSLGLTLPMLYFSRDMYSEPLAAALTFGGLALLWLAQQQGTRSLWFLAGFTAGAGLLTRIDGLITLAALALFAGTWLATAERSQRRSRLGQAACLIIGSSITALLGWFDLTELSRSYYDALTSQVHQELFALLAAILASCILVLFGWRTGTLAWLDKKTHRWRAPAAALFIIALTLMAASRPFWYVGHHESNLPITGALQAQAGKVVDPYRSYAEHSVTWILWYVGPALAGLSVCGLALACWRVLSTRRALLLAPGLLIVLTTSLVFLHRPSITPDQVWAARRLLPIIIPGVLIYAVFALDTLQSLRVLSPRLKQCLLVGSACMALAGPLIVSHPFLRTRTHAPQVAHIREVCAALPDRAVVLWTGEMQLTAPQTTQTFCKTPAGGLIQPKKRFLVNAAERIRSYDLVPVVAVRQEDEHLLPEGSRLTQVSTARFTVLPSRLYTPPRAAQPMERSVKLGIIQSDGNILPLELAR